MSGFNNGESNHKFLPKLCSRVRVCSAVPSIPWIEIMPDIQSEHHCMSKLNAVAIIGPSGSGRTTFGRVLKKTIDPKGSDDRVKAIDIHEIIEWGKHIPTSVGDRVRQHEWTIKQGYFLPQNVLVPLVQIWIEHIRATNPRLRLILASGFPESIQHADIMHSFRRCVLVHLNASPEQCHEAALNRLWSEPVKTRDPEDLESEAVFEQRMASYNNETVPLVQRFNGAVISLDRDMAMSPRIFACLTKIRSMNEPPLDADMINTGLRILSVPAHPVHRLISAIEHPRPHPQVI